MVIERQKPVRNPFLGRLLGILVSLGLFVLLFAYIGPGVKTDPPDPGDGAECVLEKIVDMAKYPITNVVFGPGGEIVEFTVTKVGVGLDSAYAHFTLDDLGVDYQELLSTHGSTSTTQAWGEFVTNVTGESGLATELLGAGDEYIRLNSDIKSRVFRNQAKHSWSGYRACYDNTDVPDWNGQGNSPAWVFNIE